ncbi:MAG: ribokinase [Pseudomonadota bacterium]
MITVFGSMNMDLVLQVPSIPRPGETVLCPSYEAKPGGKGANQAVAAARAGGKVAMVGAVGPDGYGQEVRDNFSRIGVDISGIRTSDRPTAIATIAVDPEAENAICVASGANRTIYHAWVSDDQIGPGSLLVLQMEVPAEQNWTLVDRAKSTGASVMLSLAPAAPIPETALAGLDYFLVNRLEAAMVAESLGWTVDEPQEIARRLADVAQTTCVVTLGGDGALAVEPDGTAWRQGILPVDAVDTTGAGDTFAGVLAASLDDGLPLPEAMHRASVAAGLACMGLGAQESTPTGDEIDAAIGRVEGARLAG